MRKIITLLFALLLLVFLLACGSSNTASNYPEVAIRSKTMAESEVDQWVRTCVEEMKNAGWSYKDIQMQIRAYPLVTVVVEFVKTPVIIIIPEDGIPLPPGMETEGSY